MCIRVIQLFRRHYVVLLRYNMHTYANGASEKKMILTTNIDHGDSQTCPRRKQETKNQFFSHTKYWTCMRVAFNFSVSGPTYSLPTSNPRTSHHDGAPAAVFSDANDCEVAASTAQ